ncbi:hypothetical protein AU255_03940 [Methyloprofundus sedimenti]|uniref:Kazal-like domain-containing protein n=1 Tax=Methyloprofundus sedimenti TaxID=1420851 RepID=A0A1V8M6C9_9GAMM|nr:hypothetical protein [Methyloprofundus sedimenti]OQK17058.1 hypothetical protein AU255_03940 [Methyloprofundus sedimenti]
MKVRNSVFLMILMSVSACQSTPKSPGNLVDCPEVRPHVCTMIYAPVCAMEKNGQFTSYSSDCTACSHEEVVGYQPGVCTMESNKKQ